MGVPLAEQLNVLLLPEHTVALDGWLLIDAAVLTVNVAAFEVADPQGAALLTTQS